MIAATDFRCAERNPLQNRAFGSLGQPDHLCLKKFLHSQHMLSSWTISAKLEGGLARHLDKRRMAYANTNGMPTMRAC